MKYSPSKIKKVLGKVAQEKDGWDVDITTHWVATSKDENDGGWLDGQPNRVYEGDIIVALCGRSSGAVPYYQVVGNVYQ